MKRCGLLLVLILLVAAACSGTALAQEVQPDLAMLRVMHGAPGAPPIDVIVDGVRAFADAAYGSVTPYLAVVAGSHSIQVVQAGTTLPVLFQTTVDLKVNSYNTLSAAGQPGSFTVLPTVDGNCLPPLRIAAVRLVNLSPNAAALDAVLRGNVGVSRAAVEVPISGVASGSASSYTNTVVGTYDIDLRQPGTNRVLTSLPDVPLVAATTYTVYGIGLVDGRPGLQAVLTSDAPPFGR
ncbi:MAG TPA: DUF4397 domain-containing protein [Anaerolineae bacterium]|nr:DUF4397 domain-containing protein [Anaerolineae bacterium]HOQ99302.1 DUF4397 domain-containing protein [Anaerolineae bacterium]HPL30087.1 DUF4397 domain-containing protein [Anaerolineae bacterium]